MGLIIVENSCIDDLVAKQSSTQLSVSNTLGKGRLALLVSFIQYPGMCCKGRHTVRTCRSPKVIWGSEVSFADSGRGSVGREPATTDFVPRGTQN